MSSDPPPLFPTLDADAIAADLAAFDRAWPEGGVPVDIVGAHGAETTNAQGEG